MNNTYKLITLKNNLQVLLYPRPEIHSVILSCWINVGSSNDPKDKNGLAHLLEHLIVERTKKLDKKQFAEVQEQLVGDFSASTSDTFTIIEGVFHYSKLDASLSLIKDMLFDRSFLKTQIADAKKIIIEEIKQGDDNLEEVVSQYAKKNRFRNQPAFSSPSYGAPKTLNQINWDDVDSFYKKHYSPENIVLGLSGNFDLNSTVKTIEKMFKDDVQNQSKEKVVSPVKFSGQIMKLIPKPYSEIYAMITFPGLSRKNAPIDRLTMNLISFMLAGINSSRLFKLLRLKENLVYDISTETIIEHNYGIFDISWACRPENFSKILKKVLTEFETFKNGKISSLEIQRFCEVLNKHNEMSFDNASDALYWLLEDSAYENKIVLPEEIVKMRNKITTVKIQEIAKQILDLKKINIVAVGPVKNLKLPLKLGN